MLSRPDFLEKQIIVVTCEQLKDLSLRNDNLLLKRNKKIINQLSCYKIFSIFVIGDFTLTTKLVNRLLKYQISIYCIDALLRPKFVIGNQLEGNYILRSKQYLEENTLEIAKSIVKNKIENQLFLLKSIRDKDTKLKTAITKMKTLIDKVSEVDNDDSLRWIEWNASKWFFANYFKELKWYKRMPRTRADIPNFLMDIGYTYLYWFIEANLNLYGFDIYMWVYHKLFYERKSLVCDLVEPFRCIVDRAIRKMYNLKQIDEKDFKFKNGEYWIDWEKRKKYTNLFLKEILLYKEEIFLYIKEYYKFIMNQQVNDMPVFNFEKK